MISQEDIADAVDITSGAKVIIYSTVCYQIRCEGLILIAENKQNCVFRSEQDFFC